MGQISNYNANNGADIISRWASTSYPIRSDNQVLPQNSVNDVKTLTSNYLYAAAAKMDSVVTACSSAIGNSGITSFTMIDESGNEVNQFQEKITAISNLATELAARFRKLKTDLDSFASQCRTDDLNDLSKWRQSDEYKQQQNSH